MKQLLKRGLLATISGATRRTAVLLSQHAAGKPALLAVRVPYRVSGNTLDFNLIDEAPGAMHATFVGAGGADESSSFDFAYHSPGVLSLRLGDGMVSFRGRDLGSASATRPITARRFSCVFELRDQNGGLRARSTSHYLPRDAQAVDESYFSGEDYRDYEAESEAVHRDILATVHRHGVRGPVLEVGCATGGTLAALQNAGYDVTGLDISTWAVARARSRVGDVVWQCDVERDPIPGPAADRGPFGCLVLASVLEHFADPPQVVARLTPLTASGATIVILTTNGDSLTHRLFGSDWEGYFDWTHKSVDTITPRALREWLPQIGWSVREVRTWHVWDGCGDPVHATLREWSDADARFRLLLTERELGDFLGCVAVRA